MAIFNEILEGSLNQLLVKRLAMQTPAPSPAIQPEIVPAIILENDRPEYSFLKGENLYGTAGVRAGVAPGFHSTLQLAAQGLSNGMIATVESVVADVDCWVTTGAVGWAPAGLLPAATPRDMRVNPLTAFYRASEGTVDTLSLALQDKVAYVPAKTVVNLNQILTNRFGAVSALYLSSVADQVPLNGCFLWRERPLNVGELA